MKEYHEHLNRRVRDIVEDAIAALEAVGMSHEDALALLMIQAGIRIEDPTNLRQSLRSIEGVGIKDD